MEKLEMPSDNTTELTVVLGETEPSSEGLSFKVLLERFYLFHSGKGQAGNGSENSNGSFLQQSALD
jgi:hypothetical protein